MPQYVQKAVKEGFGITRIGLLCECPITPPSPAEDNLRSALLVGIETVLAHALWAFCSKKTLTDYANLRRWNIDAYLYDGLYSHSSLIERPYGDFELSEAELEVASTYSSEMGVLRPHET